MTADGGNRIPPPVSAKAAERKPRRKSSIFRKNFPFDFWYHISYNGGIKERKPTMKKLGRIDGKTLKEFVE